MPNRKRKKFLQLIVQRWFRLFLLSWLLVAMGCSTRSAYNYHDRQDHLSGNRQLTVISRESFATLTRVKTKILKTASLDTEFKIVARPEANAMLTMVNGKPYIIVNSGLMQVIGTDQDEYAFIIAHECAHLALEHFTAQKQHRQERKKVEGLLIGAGEIVGFALGVPLGLFSMISVDSASHLVAMKYSREQEFAADHAALQLMVRAGFDPKGAQTFLHKILSHSNSFLPLLSTHPQGGERIDRIQAFLEKS